MLKRFLVFVCLLAFLPDAGAADAFSTAVALYNKKDYRACTPMLETFVRANPMNRVAYVYLANSYAAAGKYDQATKLAEYVIANFTMTPESAACGELVARIQAMGSAKTEVAKPSTGSLQSASPHSTNSPASPGKATAINIPFDLNSFVYTVRGNLDTGDVSPAFLQKVKGVVSTLPAPILGRLQLSGCKICVTPRMADKLPGFAHQRPRGWDEDKSGKHVDGLFNGEVIVCENSTSYSDDFSYVKNERYPGLLRHEIGHAVDWYFGKLSKSEEFKHAYLLELARVDVDAKERDIAYYAQKSDAGQSECFAELFAALLGGGCSNKDSMLLGAFPNTAKVIKQMAGIP